MWVPARCPSIVEVAAALGRTAFPHPACGASPAAAGAPVLSQPHLASAAAANDHSERRAWKVRRVCLFGTGSKAGRSRRPPCVCPSSCDMDSFVTASTTRPCHGPWRFVYVSLCWVCRGPESTLPQTRTISRAFVVREHPAAASSSAERSRTSSDNLPWESGPLGSAASDKCVVRDATSEDPPSRELRVLGAPSFGKVAVDGGGHGFSPLSWIPPSSRITRRQFELA